MKNPTNIKFGLTNNNNNLAQVEYKGRLLRVYYSQDWENILGGDMDFGYEPKGIPAFLEPTDFSVESLLKDWDLAVQLEVNKAHSKCTSDWNAIVGDEANDEYFSSNQGGAASWHASTMEYAYIVEDNLLTIEEISS